MRSITVGVLRAALRRPDLRDDMEVILRVTSDDGERTEVSGLHALAVDPGCTEVDALVLDGFVDEDEGEVEDGDDGDDGGPPSGKRSVRRPDPGVEAAHSGPSDASCAVAVEDRVEQGGSCGASPSFFDMQAQALTIYDEEVAAGRSREEMFRLVRGIVFDPAVEFLEDVEDKVAATSAPTVPTSWRES
jgi:hypothetical protein